MKLTIILLGLGSSSKLCTQYHNKRRQAGGERGF